MMDDMNKYCEILGLEPGATPEEVKQAYRDMVKVWHPDRFSHDPRLQQKAQEKLKEINHAYERLRSYQSSTQTSQSGSRYYQPQQGPESDSTQSADSQKPPHTPKKTPHKPFRASRYMIWLAIVVALVMFRLLTQLNGLPEQTPSIPQNILPTIDIERAKEHFERGVQFSLQKEYDAAIKEYKMSLKLNPGVAVAHSNLGFAYMDKGDIENARIEQRKALEINPKLVNGYYGLALALEKQNDIDGAIKAWKAYLNLAQT